MRFVFKSKKPNFAAMRKIFVLLLVSCGVLTLQNCSNEFELTENWKDITIVYGLLDASQSAQYIRIEKAFLDESTSALIIAQESDSLFYNDIVVELQEIPLSGGSGGSSFILDRVDANLEGFQKDDGVFANSPNYVYKFDGDLKASARYRLVISKAEGDEITTETRIISDFGITFPTTDFRLRFESDRPQTFRWNDDANAAFYDLEMRIHIKEVSLNSDTTFKTLNWSIAKNIQGDAGQFGLVTYELENGAEFYRFLQQNLDVVAGTQRTLVGIDIAVYAGGDELLKYIEAGQANSGITSAETLPLYSNISGDGLGLFSTRFTEVEAGYLWNAALEDTLKDGPYTNQLGF
jgi:hypothetical protein